MDAPAETRSDDGRLPRLPFFRSARNSTATLRIFFTPSRNWVIQVLSIQRVRKAWRRPSAGGSGKGFFNAVCLTIRNMPGLPQELIDERRPLFRVNLDPNELRAKRPLYLQRLDAHLAWLAEALADGRKFVLGKEPSAARFIGVPPDLVRKAEWWKGQVNDLIAFASAIDPWFKRVAAIGHGDFSEMTPDQAIEAAKTKRGPSEPHAWSSEAQNVGLRRGDWVSVTPDDYGNAVYGSILSVGRPMRSSCGTKILRVGKVDLVLPTGRL